MKEFDEKTAKALNENELEEVVGGKKEYTGPTKKYYHTTKKVTLSQLAKTLNTTVAILRQLNPTIKDIPDVGWYTVPGNPTTQAC